MPAYSSLMDLMTQPSVRSMRSIRENDQKYPDCRRPSKAGLAGDLKWAHQAFTLSSSDIVSTSIAPQWSTALARNLGRNAQTGYGSPPVGLSGNRDNASAMALSFIAMRSAAAGHPYLMSDFSISRANLVNWSGWPAPRFAYATEVESPFLTSTNSRSAHSRRPLGASFSTHESSQLIPSRVATLGHAPCMNESP